MSFGICPAAAIALAATRDHAAARALIEGAKTVGAIATVDVLIGGTIEGATQSVKAVKGAVDG